MLPLKAHVKDGQIVLDNAPTDLPDGTEVELYLVDGEGFGGDFDDAEREKLHESIRESIEQMKAGQLIDANEALAELRAHR